MRADVLFHPCCSVQRQGGDFKTRLFFKIKALLLQTVLFSVKHQYYSVEILQLRVMHSQSYLKVHYATFSRAVSKNKNRALDAGNSSLQELT